MSLQRSFGNACCALVLLAGALLLFTVGVASGEPTLPSAQVKYEVSAALKGSPDALEFAILGIVESVPADEVGQVAADILAAAKNATRAQKTAIGKALAIRASALESEGQFKAVRAIVAAMESAAAEGQPAVLAAYNKKMASVKFVSVATGADGAGLNTQVTSPAE